ncbi:MAG: TetR/AcrR family transcriptional regulator [Pseudomonadota bacterium]
MTKADAKTARPDTKTQLLEAAKRVLLTEGYAGLSTRAIAAEADTQMSQIRYHFGSKEGLVLALFAYMNQQLIDRQAATFTRSDLSIAEKWDKSCDYLDVDLASGYVGVLQELIAAGWSNDTIGAAVRDALKLWRALLTDLARDFERRHGTLGPFTSEDVAALGSAVFLGAEACILLGYEDESLPIRRALRRLGPVIAHFEAAKRED